MTNDSLRLDDQAESDRQTASLAGMAVVLALIVLGLALVHELHTLSTVEDCLLSGRLVCGMAQTL